MAPPGQTSIGTACKALVLCCRYDGVPVNEELRERLEGVTHLVEHPIQMKPPGTFVLLGFKSYQMFKVT